MSSESFVRGIPTKGKCYSLDRRKPEVMNVFCKSDAFNESRLTIASYTGQLLAEQGKSRRSSNGRAKTGPAGEFASTSALKVKR